MRPLRRPRFWISLFLGLVVGLLAAMLPYSWPAPTWSLSTSSPTGMFTCLLGVSPDGRYLVTGYGKVRTGPNHFPPFTVQVWDRDGSAEQPLIEESTPKGIEMVRLPDVLFHKNTLAIIFRPSDEMKPCAGACHDLRGLEKRRPFVAVAEHFLYSPDGKLLFVRGNSLRDLEPGAELRRIEPMIGGYRLYPGSFQSDCAIYYNMAEGKIRICSLLTGDERARVADPNGGRIIAALHVSEVGRVVVVIAKRAEPKPGEDDHCEAIIDAASGECRTSDDSPFGFPGTLSADGTYALSFAKARTPSPLEKCLPAGWFPVEIDDGMFRQNYRLSHWATDTELARFTQVERVIFSSSGNALAVHRRGDSFDVYEVPVLQKPYLRIAGAALVAGIGALGVAWVWSRWRMRGRRR